MSKVIEDAAQDFAAINEDKASNSAHSYSKYDIADAYQQGAEFGYELAENRIKKEYEEKLRWTRVEENPPPLKMWVICKHEEIYDTYFFDNEFQMAGCIKRFLITEWRFFL